MARYVPPFDKREQHLPGMNYCGPGTNVRKRMQLKVEPVDELDRAAFRHDIVTEPRGPYTSRGHPQKLRMADSRLLNDAIRLRDSGYRPRWIAELVIKAMTGLLVTGARGRK
jgi:hypothetical protein